MALRLVLTHLETGEAINTLIKDVEFTAVNCVEATHFKNESSVFTEEGVCNL